MSFFLQNSELEHGSMLFTTLSTWATSDQDICILSTEGHKIYTSKRLLAFSSPNLLADILTSSTETALSLPFSSSSLYVLLDLLSEGMAFSKVAIDEAEVEEAALCLGIPLQLHETSTQEESSSISETEESEINGFDAKDSTTDTEDKEENYAINGLEDAGKDGNNEQEVIENYLDMEVTENFPEQEVMENYPKQEVMKNYPEQILENVKENPVTNDGQIPCDYCPGLFKENGMKTHIGKIHPEVKTNFLAKSAPKTSIKTEESDNNDSVVKEDDSLLDKKYDINSTLRCEFCNKIFSQKRYLRLHKRKQHPSLGGDGDIFCKYCPKQFNEIHMYSHVRAKHPSALQETNEDMLEEKHSIEEMSVSSVLSELVNL